MAGKFITLGELAARQRQERIDYLASPEGQESLRLANEKSAHELRIQSIVQEGHDAVASGLAVDICPYPEDSTERRLWVYGYENPPPSEDDDEDEDEDEIPDDEDEA